MDAKQCHQATCTLSLFCNFRTLYFEQSFVTNLLTGRRSRQRCTNIAISCTSIPRSAMTGQKNLPGADRPATLKMLAEHLNLSPATVSIVLNNSPVATSIPAATKQRIHAAAKKFSYRPNLHARMLRSRLTNTIGIIAPELSEGYFTGVMLGAEH